MSEETKTFRVTVPLHVTVCGRAFYIVEAETEEQALELVKSGEVYVDDMVTDRALDDLKPYFDEADVEEW